ncbi:hypothetical protein NKI94_07110 [Mesorhizobium australicum]|uniref:hypothetical protein n=1 Tax=Mesorhizobium australicum TaxID=536018 RepID=UPI00333D95CE
MVSLTVLSISDPESFPGEKDFEALSREEAIENIRDWFFYNFEDPVHNAPYDGAEGGYQFIWGGPYETRQEVEGRFGGFIDPEVLEGAIEEIEEHEGPEWTVSERRVVPESDDDDNSYHADLTNDAPRFYEEEQARATVTRDAAALLEALDALHDQSPGIGHNKPPEALDPPVGAGDLSELRGAATAVRQESLSAKPDVQIVAANSNIILKWVRAVASWAAGKADTFAENAAKSAGTTAGPAAVAGLGYMVSQYFSPQHATVFEAALKLGASMAHWISVLLPGV